MSKALVVLSGGQDSTTCLFWATHSEYEEVHCITFDYGQRHSIETESAGQVFSRSKAASWELLHLPPSILKSTSPLVDRSVTVGQYESAADLPGGVEPTFVPARNILFLTLAANRAVALGCEVILTGVSGEDYGGYPDCRAEFIGMMELTLNQGIFGHRFPAESKLRIATPLMHMNKKATVEMAAKIPGCFAALKFSHTCYNGVFPPCGSCHACILRGRGFHEANYVDPLVDRAYTINTNDSTLGSCGVKGCMDQHRRMV